MKYAVAYEIADAMKYAVAYNGFIIARCFVLNGVAGYIFGELFRKYGIGYAMTAHAMAHIVKFIIFAIFI